MLHRPFSGRETCTRELHLACQTAELIFSASPSSVGGPSLQNENVQVVLTSFGAQISGISPSDRIPLLATPQRSPPATLASMELFNAAGAGDTQLVRQLIASKTDLEWKDVRRRPKRASRLRMLRDLRCPLCGCGATAALCGKRGAVCGCASRWGSCRVAHGRRGHRRGATPPSPHLGCSERCPWLIGWSDVHALVAPRAQRAPSVAARTV